MCRTVSSARFSPASNACCTAAAAESRRFCRRGLRWFSKLTLLRPLPARTSQSSGFSKRSKAISLLPLPVPSSRDHVHVCIVCHAADRHHAILDGSQRRHMRLHQPARARLLLHDARVAASRPAAHKAGISCATCHQNCERVLANLAPFLVRLGCRLWNAECHFQVPKMLRQIWNMGVVEGPTVCSRPGHAQCPPCAERTLLAAPCFPGLPHSGQCQRGCWSATQKQA